MCIGIHKNLMSRENTGDNNPVLFAIADQTMVLAQAVFVKKKEFLSPLFR